MGKKERIYELASGYFTKEVDHVVDGVEIQDEFREGSTCSQLYEEMTELEKKSVRNCGGMSNVIWNASSTAWMLSQRKLL